MRWDPDSDKYGVRYYENNTGLGKSHIVSNLFTKRWFIFGRFKLFKHAGH